MALNHRRRICRRVRNGDTRRAGIRHRVRVDLALERSWRVCYDVRCYDGHLGHRDAVDRSRRWAATLPEDCARAGSERIRMKCFFEIPHMDSSPGRWRPSWLPSWPRARSCPRLEPPAAPLPMQRPAGAVMPYDIDKLFRSTSTSAAAGTAAAEARIEATHIVANAFANGSVPDCRSHVSDRTSGRTHGSLTVPRRRLASTASLPR